MADDEGRLEGVERKLDALIDVLGARAEIDTRLQPAGPLEADVDQAWDWDEFGNQVRAEAEELIPANVLGLEAPDELQPDAPRLPAFPRPVEIDAGGVPAGPRIVDDAPAGASAVQRVYESTPDPRAIPTGRGAGHEFGNHYPTGDQIVKDLHKVQRQMRDVPIEDR